MKLTSSRHLAELIVFLQGLHHSFAHEEIAQGSDKRHAVRRHNGLRGDSRGYADARAVESEDPAPLCSCDCCTVVARRPDEIIGGASIKCSPSGDHPDMCGEQCSITEDDRVLTSEAAGGSLDYQRFCFFECKPASGLSSAMGEQCLILDDRDARSVVDKRGNAMDPAFVYGTSPVMLPVADGSSPLIAALTMKRNVVSNADIAAAPAAAPVTTEDAIKAATDGRYQAQTQEQGAQMQARMTRAAEIKQAAATSHGAFSAMDDIRSAVKNSQASASRAASSAASAAHAFQEAKQLTWQTALNTASNQVDQLRAQVRSEAEIAVTPPPGEEWRKKASEAAADASKRYLDSVNDAQQAVYAYSARAQEEAAQARALQQKANQLTDIANALNAVGKTQEAQAKIREAMALAAHAQDLSQWTKDLMKTAGITAGSIDTYYKWAQQAATKAGSEILLTDEQKFR